MHIKIEILSASAHSNNSAFVSCYNISGFRKISKWTTVDCDCVFFNARERNSYYILYIVTYSYTSALIYIVTHSYNQQQSF